MSSEFLKRYTDVFNDDGTVKACGRDKCTLLLIECYKVEKNTYFGDVKNGFMNVENVLGLVKRLKEQEQV